MTLMRFLVRLDGWTGGPGVNVYHIEMSEVDQGTVNGVANLLHDAYDGVKTYLLGGMKVSVHEEAIQLDPTTGELQKVWAVSVPPQVSGGGTNPNMTRDTMGVVRHITDGVLGGQRLNGRTFIGPLAAGCIGGDGLVVPSAVTALSAMFDGLQDIAGNERLMVYHRPNDKVDVGDPRHDGYAAHVQRSQCLQKPGNLRSRRD